MNCANTNPISKANGGLERGVVHMISATTNKTVRTVGC
jgi:hypothetical protein